MTDDIVSFIRARLDEDADQANNAIGDSWKVRIVHGHVRQEWQA